MSTENFPVLDPNFSIPNWLISLELGQYALGFAQNEITPEVLFSLTDADLEKCGITSLGHRKKILAAIEHLKSGNQPQVPAGAATGAAHHPGELPPPTVPAVAPRKPPFIERIGGRFLYISIIAHVIFGLIATWFVVQRIEAKRKLTFQAGQKGPNPNSRAIEHKVQVQKQKNNMSAPAQSKRITTTAVSARVAIPSMPMPMTSDMTPSRMAGSGGAGVNFGAATMGAAGGGGAGGSMMPFFGLREAGGGALAGNFYDLKQTQDRKPTGMTPQKYAEELTQFVKRGWNADHFNRFFKAPSPLYTNQIFIPDISADKGPSAFNLQKEVKPSMWIVLYKGTVSPPESGMYHFVGHGDDILMVRFNGRLVLCANWDQPNFGIVDTKWTPKGTYQYGWPTANTPFPFRKGDTLDLRAGTSYPIDILIGEQPGGRGHAILLIEKEGVQYDKDGRGNPILPIFRMGEVKLPPLERGESVPPYQQNGPIWKGITTKSLFGGSVDVFKKP